MVWFKDDNDNDPKAAEKTREERQRNEGETRPDGSPGLRCSTCGRVQGVSAIRGCCCYFCHQTLK